MSEEWIEDLVNRLRENAEPLAEEAADAIEQLDSGLQRLRAVRVITASAGNSWFEIPEPPK